MSPDEIKAGKKYRVLEDSDHHFRPGDIVVSLEDNNDLPYCVLAKDYVVGMYDIQSYPKDKLGLLDLSELEEFSKHHEGIPYALAEEAKQTLEGMKKQFLPPVRDVLDFAIQSIEENQVYRELENVMKEVLSPETVMLLRNPEEFREWLKRGQWYVKKCDELARELNNMKEFECAEVTERE